MNLTKGQKVILVVAGVLSIILAIGCLNEGGYKSGFGQVGHLVVGYLFFVTSIVCFFLSFGGRNDEGK